LCRCVLPAASCRGQYRVRQPFSNALLSRADTNLALLNSITPVWRHLAQDLAQQCTCCW
jgi:hypothetical protein